MKQVPLVDCSMCKVRWPLGGVVDTVHPISGNDLPKHPQLQAVGQKVVCYECMFKYQLDGEPLTEALYESLSRRPHRPSPQGIIRIKHEASKPRVLTTRVIRDTAPQALRILSRDSAMQSSVPREIFRTVRKDDVPVVSVYQPFHADPLPATPINPALPSDLATRIKQEMRDEEALANARKELKKKIEIERADKARSIVVAGRDIPVVQGRMQGMFLRPSRWSLTEPVFQRIPMGTASPAYVPMRDDVLNEVFELAENADIEVRLAEEPAMQVMDRFKGLAPEHTQALRRQIKRFQKKQSG